MRLHDLRFFQWLEDVGIPLFPYHPVHICFLEIIYWNTDLPIKIQPHSCGYMSFLVGSL